MALKFKPILYLEDWDRYPHAVADVSSRNYSWVEMAYKYQTMGIQNWYFFLALHNEELRGIDPHSDKLTEEQQELILLECAINPWYALREVIRIPDGDNLIMLEANRGNIAMFWCVFNSFITFVQQIRQTGKTLNTRFLVVLFHIFITKGATHVLFTKGDLRRDEIKYYKKFRAALPKWMWYLTPKDTDNQYEFTTLMNENQTFSYVPQGSPDDANSVGRGKTPDFVNVDEPPFLPNAKVSIPALIASTTASFDKARKYKKFHAILYTTTAGDLSTESGKYVYENIKKKGMFFSEMLFDADNRDDAVTIIMANSKCEDRSAPYVDISFNHLQLGKTNDWLKGKIATTPGTRDQIKRDFLGQWTFGSTSNPIPEKLLNRIRDNINSTPIVVTDEKYRYQVKYHREVDYVKSRQAILGLDTSNAVGRDAITGVLVDVETSETLASFMVGESSLTWFAVWLAKFLEEHPLVTLVPEAKSTWIGILDDLLIELPLKGIDPGRRIYNRIVDSARGTDNEKRNYREYSAGTPTERKYFPYRNQFGFPTSGPLREDLYVVTLREATNDAPKLIRDASLIDELSSLVEKNNRIDHKASGHDDHVISWLIAQWFLREGRNLDHYGIDNRKVLCRLKVAATGDDVKEQRAALRQERLNLELDKLTAQLADAKGMLEIRYIESKISSLKTEIREDAIDDIGSIDRKSQMVADKKAEANRNAPRLTTRNYGFNPYRYNGRF
jgi:hypothetical protein